MHHGLQYLLLRLLLILQLLQELRLYEDMHAKGLGPWMPSHFQSRDYS